MPFVRTSARAPARRIPRRPGRALALLSVALLVAACTTSGSSGGQDLTVAVVPGVDTAPLAIAAKDGLFSQQGITVTVKDVSSSAEAYRDLLNGSANVAAGDYAAFFYAIANGQSQLKLIADGYDAATGTMQVLTLPDSNITSVSQLQGKKVGTPSAQVAPFENNFPYNIETLATESELQSDGVNPADIYWDQLPASQMLSALSSHQVDAILVTEPQLTEAEEQLGAVELLDSCSGVTANLPLTGYFSTAAVAGQETGTLTAFQKALSIAKGDAASRSIVQSALTGENISAEDAALVNVGQYPTFLNVGQVQRVADLMYESGMIIAPVSVASLQFK
ncbi:MAG: ABC transporter substrate-binding protein [Streptosporangiaceae bacterium]